MVLLFLAAALVSGVPDEVTAEVCFASTDGAMGYDPDGPIFHQQEFDASAALHKLDATQTRALLRWCKDYVTETRYIVMQSRKLREQGKLK